MLQEINIFGTPLFWYLIQRMNKGHKDWIYCLPCLCRRKRGTASALPHMSIHLYASQYLHQKSIACSGSALFHLLGNNN